MPICCSCSSVCYLCSSFCSLCAASTRAGGPAKVRFYVLFSTRLTHHLIINVAPDAPHLRPEWSTTLSRPGPR